MSVCGEIVNMCGQISRGIGWQRPTSLMQLAVSKVLDLTSDFSVYEKESQPALRMPDGLWLEVEVEGTFYISPESTEADAAHFVRKRCSTIWCCSG